MMPNNIPFFSTFSPRHYNKYTYVNRSNTYNDNNQNSNNKYLSNYSSTPYTHNNPIYDNSKYRSKTNNDNFSSLYRNQRDEYKNKKANSHNQINVNPSFDSHKSDSSESVRKDDILFEIFGIKFHQDDLLLIGLIFFLYTEGVKDDFLFIALILLLLSWTIKVNSTNVLYGHV